MHDSDVTTRQKIDHCFYTARSSDWKYLCFFFPFSPFSRPRREVVNHHVPIMSARFTLTPGSSRSTPAVKEIRANALSEIIGFTWKINFSSQQFAGYRIDLGCRTNVVTTPDGVRGFRLYIYIYFDFSFCRNKSSRHVASQIGRYLETASRLFSEIIYYEQLLHTL